MNVALVFDGLQIGGIERVGADYAKILIKLGHDVTVINLNPKLTEMKKEYPAECKFIDFSFPRKFAPEQYAQLIKKSFIWKCAYPIAYAVFSLENLLHKLFCRVMTNKIEMQDVVIAFSGHFNDLTFVAKDFLKTRNKICWLHGALYSYVLISDGYLNLYNKIKNLVVLVDDAQEEVLCYNHITDLNIHKIYNPTFIGERVIDEKKVKELQAQYGKFMVMVSRFEYPHKDHYTVAKALEIVRSKYKEDVSLLFVGNGPDEEKIKEYVSTLSQDAQEHIHFMGARSDVQNYYKAAHLLVHASVAGEGLPTIMLEAMAYDLPCVVTDSKTGPREILGDNKYGRLCHVQDPEDMAREINYLCEDKELYHQYKLLGKERLKDFYPETISEQLNKALMELTSE